MKTASITKVAAGTLTTTEGTEFTFKRILVPSHHRVPTLYDVPSGQPGVSIRVEVEWEHVARVELTRPDVLLALPAYFHMHDVPLIVDGVDVRNTARHGESDGLKVYVIPSRGQARNTDIDI